MAAARRVGQPAQRARTSEAQYQQENELLETLKGREQAIEEYRQAAAAHVEEMNRLRDAANEQGSLVAELEDELATSEKRQAAASAEVAQLQKALAEVENADRQRRSRLAELEGFLLRAQHTSAKESEARAREQAEIDDLRTRLAVALRDGGDTLRTRLVEAEAALAESQAALAVETARLADLEAALAESQAALAVETARLADLEAALAESQAARASDTARLADLEQKVRANDERERRLSELRRGGPRSRGSLRAPLFDLETQYQAATMAAARVPSLEARLAEIEARLTEPTRQ